VSDRPDLPGRNGDSGASGYSGAGRYRVLAVATEWSSAHGGLSTFNRQLCCALAAAQARVACVVLAATAADRADAAACGVSLVEAQRSLGFSETYALARKPPLPQDFVPNVVIGHGRVTGPSAKILTEDVFSAAKRLHVVHMAPDEIEWHKLDRGDDAGVRAEERTELELQLGRTADHTIAVGPRLHRRLLNDLHPFDVPAPLRLDPGFDVQSLDRDAEVPSGLWRVLLFGRTEDASLKGLDLAARAVGRAVDRSGMTDDDIEFVVRGAPVGSSAALRDQIRTWSGLRSLAVVVRPYTTDVERLSADLRRASLVLMPSRSEGFGLVGVESIVAGRPTLVSASSGLGALLREVLAPEAARRMVVGMSGDDDEITDRWARQIEAVLRDRESAFRRAGEVRGRLATVKTWADAALALLSNVEIPVDVPAVAPQPVAVTAAAEAGAAAAPRPVPTVPTPATPTPAQFSRLVTLLFSIPTMETTWRQIVSWLPVSLTLGYTRSDVLSHEALELFRHFRTVADQRPWEEFVAVLRMFYPASLPRQAFEDELRGTGLIADID
jgi:glycosyltransferase involved in cell wall biosynthesis